MRIILITVFVILFVSVLGKTKNFPLKEKCEKVAEQVQEHHQKNVRRSNWPPGKGGGFRKTQGAVWPKPQSQVSKETFFIVRPSKFSFQTGAEPNYHTCDILQYALERYYNMIFNPPRLSRMMRHTKESEERWMKNENYAGFIETFYVYVETPCDNVWPDSKMDESYIIDIENAQLAILMAKTVWGALRGLETFSQLVYQTADGLFVVNNTVVEDYPRFPHRGVMLDTARHYLPKQKLMDTIETMAQNKFNVFHWHIVDDNSFPYQSKSFPEMSKQGAYDDYTHIYTVADLSDVITHGRMRGIRVIPEFDTPGHTQAWGLGVPGLLTTCYQNVSGKLVPNGYGPIDPTKESTYKFLTTLFTEVSATFADSFIHLGGDEVSFDCWKSNPDVLKFMKQKGFGDDFAKLEGYYMNRVLQIVSNLNHSYIIWEEVINNGAKVKPDAIVDVWLPSYEDELNKVTKLGYRTLLSACWYLDYISYGSDWTTYYKCDPHSFNGTDAQKKLVMGGEACLWAEFVDSTNVTPRLWPRASATAEKLWSSASANDTDEAGPRLEEHRCRMLLRGTNAEPANGPSYCPVDFKIQ